MCKTSEKLSQKRQQAKDSKEWVGRCWLDMLGKSIQQEKTTCSGKHMRDSSFLYAVTLNLETVELPKRFKRGPSSRGGQSALLWTLLPKNLAICKQVASPSLLSVSIWRIRVWLKSFKGPPTPTPSSQNPSVSPVLLLEHTLLNCQYRHCETQSPFNG